MSSLIASPPTELPSHLSYTVVNPTSILLMWAAPNTTNLGEITGYCLSYKTNVGQVIPVNTDIRPNQSSIVVTDLRPGRTYTFRLCAKNVYGAGPSANLTIQLPAAEAEKGKGISQTVMYQLACSHQILTPFT